MLQAWFPVSEAVRVGHVLLGYFPKRLDPPPAWMVARGVAEIGSVALCIAGGPEGWDVVSRSGGSYFECSPLSCNLEAERRTTNRYCPFPDFDAAVELARSGEAFEPGPYHVVEVWRRGIP